MIIKKNVSFFKKLCSEGSWTNWVAHFAKLKRIIVASPFPVKEYYLLQEEVQRSVSLRFKCPASTVRKIIPMANPSFSYAFPERGCVHMLHQLSLRLGLLLRALVKMRHKNMLLMIDLSLKLR